MGKTQGTLEDALLKYGIPKTSSDFEAATAALKSLCESSGASAETVLESIKANEHPSHAAHAATESIIDAGKTIEMNEARKAELEKSLAALERNAEWMLRAPSKERAGTPVAKLGSGLHEKIVGSYYSWKASGIEGEIRSLEKENEALAGEQGEHSQTRMIARAFENMLRSSELGSAEERKGAELIRKALR